MDIELTRDSEKLLCVMYKNYLEKRKSGIKNPYRELSRIEMIHCHWADNIAYRVIISDSGISNMENRFKNGLTEVIDFISKFIPFAIIIPINEPTIPTIQTNNLNQISSFLRLLSVL